MCLCKVIWTLQTQKPSASSLKTSDEVTFDSEFENLDASVAAGTKIHLKRQKDPIEITEFWAEKSRYLAY